MNSIKKLFSSESVFQKNELVYRLVRLNLIFSTLNFPWLIVNGILKLTPQTYIFFAITGVWMFVNLRTLFDLLHSESVTFKGYLATLKQNLKSGFQYGFVGVLALSVLLLEVMIILGNRNLVGMFPLFFIAIIMVATIMLYLAQMPPVLKNRSTKETLKYAMALSWHNPVKSFACFLILMLWLSVGYQLPIINFLIGNVVCFYILDKMMNRFTDKYLTKLQRK